MVRATKQKQLFLQAQAAQAHEARSSYFFLILRALSVWKRDIFTGVDIYYYLVSPN